MGKELKPEDITQQTAWGNLMYAFSTFFHRKALAILNWADPVYKDTRAQMVLEFQFELRNAIKELDSYEKRNIKLMHSVSAEIEKLTNVNIDLVVLAEETASKTASKTTHALIEAYRPVTSSYSSGSVRCETDAIYDLATVRQSTISIQPTPIISGYVDLSSALSGSEFELWEEISISQDSKPSKVSFALISSSDKSFALSPIFYIPPRDTAFLRSIKIKQTKGLPSLVRWSMNQREERV